MKSLVDQIQSIAVALTASVALVWSPPTVYAKITDWAPVVDPAKNVLNADPNKQAIGGSLAVLATPFGSKLYAAWTEMNSNGFQVRIAVYNGNDLAPTWSQVDSRVNGIPRASNQGITFNPNFGLNGLSRPRLAECNGILYAAWSENSRNGSPYAVRVARYNGNDGAPDWTFIDGNTTAGLNFNSKQSADIPALVSFQGRLFVFWREQGGGKRGYQLRARAYSPTVNSWTWVDGGAAAGLNVDSARALGTSIAPVVHESRSKLYVGFTEFDANDIQQIRVKVYLGGASWALADGGATLKLNPAVTIDRLAAGASPAGISLAWSELNAAGVYQIRLASYDGANDAAPSWIRLDGGHPEIGLNYNPSASGRGSRVITFKGKMYRSWLEPSETDGSDQLRVRCWDGAQWAWADGGGPLSTANPFATRSMGVSSMAVFDSKLYLLSTEPSLSPTGIQCAFVSVGLETP